MARHPRTIQNLSMSKRQVKRYAVYISLVMAVIMILMYLRSDPCHSAWHTELLCDEFALGNIAGNMCYDLCVLKTVYLSGCVRDHYGNMIYTHNDTTVVKVYDRYPRGTDTMSSFSHVYNKPEQGVSMDQFRKMVGEHILKRLGSGDHSYRVQQLMNVADANKDDKVSLAEAKTLWALLKHNEFLVLQILDNTFHVPHVDKFCGEAYMLVNLPPRSQRYLYRQHGGLLRFILPNTYKWGFPKWVDRGKIAVGFLEFALEIYQHQSDGSFYLCNMNETNVGYSYHHDFLTEDFTDVLPRSMLQSYMHDVRCTTHDQCRYTKHCTTVCDKDNRKCTGDLVEPNLSLVCGILSPYLLPDIPKVIRADFLNMVFRCSQLRTNSPDFDVQHSLIINDLKSLLWRHISSEI